MADKEQVLALAERFGRNLRRVRKREDLSQERLASRASLHRAEIGLLEHGERVCRIDTLIQLSGAMAVPPGELLDGIEWIPRPPGGRGHLRLRRRSKRAATRDRERWMSTGKARQIRKPSQGGQLSHSGKKAADPSKSARQRSEDHPTENDAEDEAKERATAERLTHHHRPRQGTSQDSTTHYEPLSRDS